MCYFDEVLHKPEEAVELLAETATKFGEFDFIAGTGLSGWLLLVPLSIRLEKPIAAVRKAEGNGHSYRHEMPETIRTRRRLRYVIVDDFISTGRTVDRIKEELDALGEHQCVGVACYHLPERYIMDLPEWHRLTGVPVGIGGVVECGPNMTTEGQTWLV